LGNITNRVFDSSGPEGKVRGTPQQIIEKYQVLARDAQLSNDRVAAENFQQHAEHYTRLLAQATREMQAEADARRIAHEEQQAQQARQRQQNDDRQPRQNGQNGQNGSSHRRTDGEEGAENRTEGFAVVHNEGYDTTLVDTPEARMQDTDATDDRNIAAPRAEQPRENRENRNEGRKDARPARDGQRDGQPRDGQARDGRPPRAPRPDRAPSDVPADAASAEPAAGDDTAAPKPRRNTRKPRKPAGDAPQGQDFAEPADPSRAAE
jgi:hypothetical protein